MDLTAIRSATAALAERLATYAPSVLSGLGLLLGGYTASRVARRVVQKGLASVRVDSALAGTRIGSVISALGKNWSASRVVGELVFLTLLLLTLNTAAGYWGLTGLQGALTGAVGYLPKALSALGLLAGGTYIAGVVRRSVGAVLRELKNPAANLLETATEVAILFLVGLVALDVLGVNLSFITGNLTLIIGAMLVIAVFLGCWALRAPAEELVANYYLRRMLSVGDHVETKTHRGTILEFVPLGLILREGSGDELFIPARELLLGGLKRRQALKPDSPSS